MEKEEGAKQEKKVKDKVTEELMKVERGNNGESRKRKRRKRLLE
jgi:hypothetical protein